MERGDIYFVSLDPASGHEQQGMRPVLVISPGAFNRLTKKNTRSTADHDRRQLCPNGRVYRIAHGNWHPNNGSDSLRPAARAGHWITQRA